MKKILFVFLVLFLLFIVGCSSESSVQDSEDSASDQQGYIEDIDQDLSDTDLGSMDEDLNLNWI